MKCFQGILIAVWAVSIANQPTSELSAALIDFNIDPATGNPFQGDVVALKGDEWQSTYGVTFYYGPIINGQGQEFFNIREGVNPDNSGANAFDSAFGPDSLAPGDLAGGYFLSSDTIIDGPAPSPFTIEFDQNQSYVSMGIIDIDTREDWRIDAFNSSGQILDSVFLLTEQAPGDGLSRYFEFDQQFDDIARVQISYLSEKIPVDFAFDNLTFRTTAIPEPQLLCSFGLLSLMLCSVRNRHEHSLFEKVTE